MEPRLPVVPLDASIYDRNLNARLYDNFRMIRPASGWRDLLADITSAKVGSSAPSWATFRGAVEAYKFASNQDNSVQVALHLPHDMAFVDRAADGTVGAPKLYPHVHWSSEGVDTGDVVFTIDWTYAKGFGAGTFPTSSQFTLTAAGPGVAYTHEITETTDAAALQSADFETDGLLLMRIERSGTDVADTLTDDVFIHYVDLHYYADGLLTNERDRNNTAGELPWTKQATL